MWLNGSTSHAQPPAGVTADPAQYGLLGARLASEFSWGGVTISGRYGDALAGTESRWLQGDASLATGGRLGALGLRALVSGFGLRYLEPFSYDAAGVQLQPSIAVPIGRLVVSAAPHFSFGGWAADSLAGDLRITGGTVDLQRSFGALTTVLSGRLLTVENGVMRGTVARAGGDLVVDRGDWTMVAEVEVQRTPLEDEVGGGLRLSFTAAPGFQIHGYAGRRVRDPLFGTAGTLAVTVGASIRAGRWSAPQPPPVVSVGESRDGGRVVEFAIRAREADEVAVTGDFSGWEPIPMEEREDGWWTLARVLAPGLHHFGFLVDGSWAIPPEAPGVVEDGWGRENASIVVQP